MNPTKALLETLNRYNQDTLMETLDIRYTDAGENFLCATMPVSPRVHQPMGILHGGATAALVESVGSAASVIRINRETHTAVGLELAINHIRSVSKGTISARAEALHLGRRTHLWSVAVTDEQDRLVAQAKLTMIIITRDPQSAD